jgi:tRNA G10  N-methylase Trm11
MTELVFILGKNWLLSLAEMIVHLEDKGILDELVDYSKTAAIVSTRGTISDEEVVDIQSMLGGCFKIGRLVDTIDIDVVERAFPAKGSHSRKDRNSLKKCSWLPSVWDNPRGKRIKYGVSSYPPEQGRTTLDFKRFTRSFDEFIKLRLQDERAKKAEYVVYEEPDRRDASRTNTALWPHSISKFGLLRPPNAEILAAFASTHLYLAKSIAVYDSMLQQFRDDSRPFISSDISTSPKICRTLLTLAGARPGDTVFDPFCGTGTVLMEAALLGMKCIGLDLDGNAVEGTQSNLKWLGRELGSHIDFKVLRGNARDSDKIIEDHIDAIAFEPHLGPVYKAKPERDEALKVLADLTDLYRDTLKALTQILRPDGRIAMTIPVIRTVAGDLSIDFDQMLKGTGLQYYRFLPERIIAGRSVAERSVRLNPNRGALPERKRGQIVQRMVLMLGMG